MDDEIGVSLAEKAMALLARGFLQMSLLFHAASSPSPPSHSPDENNWFKQGGTDANKKQVVVTLRRALARDMPIVFDLSFGSRDNRF